ncbi:MAG: DNA cytosine methyltransferase [Dehalococcoidia bacterium]|nr:DNA cytosine methyltransferase [Dehalococcoidia bacterium]
MAVTERYEVLPGLVRRTVTLGDRETVTEIADVSGLDGAPAWMRWWGSFLRGQRPKPPRLARPLRIADLFCGCGGLTLGAVEAATAVGFSPLVELAVDVDAAALRVYEANFHPRRVLAKDVAGLVAYPYPSGDDPDTSVGTVRLLDPIASSSKGTIDLLLAGPPCEGHSNLNNRTRRNDPRNRLLLDAVAFAIGAECPLVVIENVPEALADRGRVVQKAVEALRSAGYSVLTTVLKATDYAVAQARRRLFLVASRFGPPRGETLQALVKRPAPDLRWAIADLETARSSPLDVPAVPSPENQRRIDYLFDHDLYELPDELRPRYHRPGHSYRSVFGRLRWEKPSSTITSGFMYVGRGRFVHPSQRRTLTPHEAARIQGFPDDFVFVADPLRPPLRSSLAKWIGDAVPPPLAYVAALAALETMAPGSARTLEPR